MRIPLNVSVTRLSQNACAEAGVDGLITVDLPPEEVDAIDTALQAVGLDNIFLISPTTPESRIKTIVDRARGLSTVSRSKGSRDLGNWILRRCQRVWR